MNAVDYDDHCTQMDGALMLYSLQPPQQLLVDGRDAAGAGQIKTRSTSNPRDVTHTDGNAEIVLLPLLAKHPFS